MGGLSYAPNLSVIAKDERISPFSKGMSHFFCCSGEPYRARTSAFKREPEYEGFNSEHYAPMFPVSGAEQFTTSDPN